MSSPRSHSALEVRLHQTLPFELSVSLNCEPGELLALVGPSGSGKTTVLRTIAGLHRVRSGNIRCGNQIWFDDSQGIHVSAQIRKTGFVFQDYALFPHKSVLENVMLATPGQSRLERRESAMRWLHRTNMQGLHAKKPGLLSGGQRQRVALARALAREPNALLMDEPFSAVDQQTRRKLYRELAQLRRELHLPILLVTHDIHEVQQLADSLCLLHRGVSLTQGPVSQVINRPQSRTIAKLVGHQNLFSAKVVHHDARYTYYCLDENTILGGTAVHELKRDSSVSLLIAPTAISVNNAIGDTDRSTLGEHRLPPGDYNRLIGTVSGAVELGDELSLRLRLDSIPKALRFRIATYEAKKLNIRQGKLLSVDIRPDGLHAMVDRS